MKALLLDCPNKSGNDIGEAGKDIDESGKDIDESGKDNRCLHTSTA
jgi:hypothetical protein